MFYFLIISIVSTLSIMILKSTYLYEEGMNSDINFKNEKRIEIMYNREILLKNAINEYIEDKGYTDPNILTIGYLKGLGYLPEGFFEQDIFKNMINYGIKFEISENKIIIKQNIENEKIRTKYLNYYKRISDSNFKNSPYYDDVNKEIIHKYTMNETAFLHYKLTKYNNTNYKELLTNSTFQSCKAIHKFDESLTSGVYEIDQDLDGIKEKVYCDMTTDGGGWTLVWSNIKDYPDSTDLQENLNWNQVTGIEDKRFKYKGSISNNIMSFEVFTPLKIWNELMNNQQGEILYQWTSNNIIEKEMISKIENFNSTDFRLILSEPKNTYDYNNSIYYTTSDLFNYHNNKTLKTFSDSSTTFCVAQNNKQPFWYSDSGDCWNGSIFGDNGAYFLGNKNTGIKGSGFIFIR